MMNRSIAIHFQSEVQFFSLKPLIEELRYRYKLVKCVYDDFSNDASGYKEMAAGLCSILQELGYEMTPIRKLENDVFDVCLAPYIDNRIKAKCFLKYEYGTLNIKPSLTYTPNVLEGYHGFLCQSVVTSELLNVYGKTFPVENLRFYGKNKKSTKRKRKQLLFAPTYNDQDEAEELVEIIKKLKEKYYVVIKGHHGTDYLKVNSGKKLIFESLADKYYSSGTSLSDLILDSDVCLFGNSSAIGEALYMKVPCAVFAKDLDLFQFAGVHTTQYQLVHNGVLPWTNKVSEVCQIIDVALSKRSISKQCEAAEELFPDNYKTGIEGYLKAIDYFLNNPVAHDYIKLHNYLVGLNKNNIGKIEGSKEQINELIERVGQLENRLKKQEILLRDKNVIMKEQSALLEEAKRKKLYRLADIIYKLEERILHVKG